MVQLLPIPLICVVCICVGGTTRSRLAMLVLPPVFLPTVSLRLGELTVGPAQDLKSHTRFPVSRVEQSSVLFREFPWVCAMNVFLVLCC